MSPAETEIAKSVVTSMRNDGWAVYEEVSFGYASPRADIVGVRKFGESEIICVVESKVSDGLAVLDQAVWWHSWAHYVYTATFGPRKRHSRVLEDSYRRFGVGRIYVRPFGDSFRASWENTGRLNRKAGTSWLKGFLAPEQQYWAPAGNADGKFYSPFQHSVVRLKEFVAAHPGCTIKEAIESIEHHWSSDACARQCVAKYLMRRIIRGIRCDDSKRSTRLYIDAATQSEMSPA